MGHRCEHSVRHARIVFSVHGEKVVTKHLFAGKDLKDRKLPITWESFNSLVIDIKWEQIMRDLNTNWH